VKRKDASIQVTKTVSATDDLLSLFPNATRAFILLAAAGIAVQVWREDRIDPAGALRWAFLVTVGLEMGRWVLWPVVERLTRSDLDHSGSVGDPLHYPPSPTVEKQLVRVHAPRMLVDGIDADDLAEFIRGLPWRLARREWTHEDAEDMPPYTFDSGRQCDQAYFAQLMNVIEKNGWVERGRGKSPRLLVDPTEMLQELGLD